jgi:hypothetical protein
MRRDHEVGVTHSVSVQIWPASFDINLKWPSVPEEGQPINWKASPPALRVSARGFVGNQVVFISEPQDYTIKDSMTGRRLNLTLFPIME